MADKVIYWSKTALTGGAAGALDSIDGTALQDGEVAHVWMSNVLYIYLLDVDSGAAESSPAIIAPDTNAGDKRWILQSYYSGPGTLYTDHIAESTAAHGVEIDGLTIKDSGLALGSDADGDMYYRASSVLARLAKGTAGYKMFMNAGGTAPVWAAGASVVKTTYDLSTASGTQAITGAGFKPSAGMCLACVDASVIWSIGVFFGAAEFSISFRGDTNVLLQGDGYISRIIISGGNLQNGAISTLDADGVTISWSKAGSPTGTVSQSFLFFR